MTYDSRADTLNHIDDVQGGLGEVIDELRRRALNHDASKLTEPEKSMFDTYTPRLKVHAYGSREYKQDLKDMGPGLAHHYANNDHHPEFHSRGVADMDLMQLTEMLADWRAAVKRSPNGDLRRSIQANARRFGYSADIERLLALTAERLGWI